MGEVTLFLLEETKMIHAITSGKGLTVQVINRIKEIAPIVDAIVIREKQLSFAEIDNGIITLLQAGVKAKQLIIHTHMELAYKYSLLGCHLAANQAINAAQHPFLCGQSAHTKEEAYQSVTRGMDYIYFSPIFPTTSKLNVPAKGLQALTDICQVVEIPVLALGGMTHTNTRKVIRAGAQGYASISMFFD